MNSYFNSLYWPYAGFQNPDIVFGTTKRSYTLRIEELLKLKHPDLDPLDPDQMLAAGLDTVFKNVRLNVIDEKYRDTFIVQFMNEFYMNEIGQETVDYFRQNLNRIINQKGRFISSMYSLAEKEYFIEYSYRTQNATSSTESTNTSSESSTNTNSQTVNGTANRTADDEDSRFSEGSDSRNATSEGTEIGRAHV